MIAQLTLYAVDVQSIDGMFAAKYLAWAIDSDEAERQAYHDLCLQCFPDTTPDQWRFDSHIKVAELCHPFR